MHLLLTDILTCPVCGPEYGLILRADEMHERRVREGALGCPNCRRNFPIHHGIAWLTGDPEPAPIPELETGAPRAATTAAADGPSLAMRVAALLAAQSGFVLITGPTARVAGEVAELLTEAQVIVAATTPPPEPETADGRYINRIVTGTALPFYARSLRGIWLSGASASALLEEAVRALHPLARLVLEPPPADANERLAALGMRVALHEQETMLAVRAGP